MNATVIKKRHEKKIKDALLQKKTVSVPMNETLTRRSHQIETSCHSEWAQALILDLTFW